MVRSGKGSDASNSGGEQRGRGVHGLVDHSCAGGSQQAVVR
jgi:hypothetical protein